ncbi:MAG: MBL fold metallo-hydrolase [Chloroflexi bacterium]|nr:MBL fold metallo-hydrolase [Chloroflexota bacterium]
MELLFLGTAAAEGYPALFCSCHHCDAARVSGGPDLRRRTAALIDGELLIDVGPDLLGVAHTFNLHLDRIAWVVQTHAHADHLLESTFTFRRAGFTATEPAHWQLCGSSKTIEQIEHALHGDGAPERVTLRAVQPFEMFQLGPYTVTGLRARHDMRIEPLFYAIERDGRALLWANDSGPWFEETWQALGQLKQRGVRFNVVVIEATMGTLPSPESPGGHMTFEECGWHHEELGRRGLLAPGARHFAHHFSHHACPLHEEITALLSPYRVQPAYDGLRIRF